MAKKKTQKIKPWYEINAAGESGPVEILIYGNIGEDFWEPEQSITAKKLIEDITPLAGRDLDVRIQSFGGSVVDGIGIHNALKRHNGVVSTYNDSVAYSAASFIACAADPGRYFMADNALLMIHAPASYSHNRPTATEHRRMADVLEKYADAMLNAYVREGGPDTEVIESWLKDNQDHYFTAQEAIDLGLIDEVMESDMQIAACLHDLDKSRFTNPAAVAAAKTPVKEKLTMATKKDEPAAKDTKTAQTTASVTDDNVIEFEKKAEAKAKADLKKRNEEILAIFQPHLAVDGMAALKDEILTDPEITVDQARAKALAKIGEGHSSINKQSTAIAGEDQRDKRVEAMSQAILGRVGAEQVDRQNPYRGLKLSEMARASLENAGVDVRGMHVEEFAPRALSVVHASQGTSDFPVILENTLHKLVLTGHNAQKPTYDRICKIGDVTDLRAWKRIVPGLIGNLDGVDEHGAYRNKPLPDGEAESIAASRKGNIINITPEVLINDDIGYIQSMATGLGAAGPRTIDRAVYALLESNPDMSDGNALFHTSHGNLAASGAAPSITTIDDAAVAMAAQTAPGEDGVILDISPEIALMHRGLQGSFIEIINAEYNDEAQKNQRKPNRVRGIVSDIVSTGLLTSTGAWYMFADPNMAPVLEVVFLNGQRTPRVTMEENFRTSGLAWKVEQPFGVGAIGTRGGYKNPGA